MSISKLLDRNQQPTIGAAINQRSITSKQPTTGGRSRSIASQYVGELVYGGLDGIITTFAVVSGVVGASLGTHIILVLGLANLLADGFSMATGAYLSAKSEHERYEREHQRTLRLIDRSPDAALHDLHASYREHGYSDDEAHQVAAIVTRQRSYWADTLLVDQHGLIADERHPLLNGVATLLAFIIAGAVPLLVYLLGLVTPIAPQTAFIASIVLAGAALFGLGAAKVRVTGQHPVRSGTEMFLVGGLAAGVAYLVGVLLRGIGAE